MSLVTDSPVHSSSSDDFAAFLDASLDSASSEEAEDPNQVETQRVKRRKVDNMENIEELQDPTSLAPSLEQTAAKSWERQHQTNLSEEASMTKDACTHPGSFGEMCILCGQRLDADSGVTFGYIHKGLRLENDEIVRLRNTDMKNLLRHKKLYLVLDLDHTLLNSTQLIHMSPQEEYLKSQTDSLQDVSKGSLFMLSFMHMMTKLRPFVRAFLKEASELFEMYIYTMGDRAYALEMAKLLDPQREYFSSRVISRDDGTHRHQKVLMLCWGKKVLFLFLMIQRMHGQSTRTI
ncbi:hypothetical protein I3843_16G110800 [Carya illinoinensis]|nr:hypothetical protein I3843_16G110800 [Carya illinoinensis]